MFEILLFCSSLLAPESVCPDPSGRCANMPIYEDYNSSYSACIYTVERAFELGVDPYILSALVYKTTKFSSKKAKKSKLYRKILKEYSCEKPGKWIRSGCHPFRIAPRYFRDLIDTYLEEHIYSKKDEYYYHKALCDFYSVGGKCTAKHKRQVKLTVNLSRRFLDHYTAGVGPNPIPYNRKRYNGVHIPDDGIENPKEAYPNRERLRYSNVSPQTSNNMSLISSVLGPDIKLTVFETNGEKKIQFRANYHDVRHRLVFSAGLTARVLPGNWFAYKIDIARHKIVKLYLKSRRPGNTYEKVIIFKEVDLDVFEVLVK